MVRCSALLALGVLALGGAAAAQTAPPPGEPRREASRPAPSAIQRAAEPGMAARTGEQRRPAAAQRAATGQARPQGQPVGGARPAGGARQSRPAGGGSLNLDLNAARATAPPQQGRPGDAFSASGPYASQAQMQRYTGRRSIQMPQAPIQLFGQQQNVQNPFQPY